MGAMPRLARLNLRDNALRGSIPDVGLLDEDTIANLGSLLPRPSISPLIELDLHNNRITGTLDHVLDMTLLQDLDVAKNQMEGTVPGELENLTDLGTRSNYSC